MIGSEVKRLRQLPQKVFYGWWIVAINAWADSLKHGTFNRGFSNYVNPLSRELGVGVGVFSLAEALGRMEGGLQGPLLGWMNDKFGPRIIMVLGSTASGVGFILLSLTDSYLYFLLVFVGLLSLGFRAGYNNALMPAINQWFRRHRALAMAVAGMGSPAGGLLIAPAVGLLVVEIGWRPIAFASGVAVLALVVPLAAFVHRSPESRGTAAGRGQAAGGRRCGRDRGWDPGEPSCSCARHAGAGGLHGAGGDEDAHLLAAGAGGGPEEHRAFGDAVVVRADHRMVPDWPEPA